MENSPNELAIQINDKRRLFTTYLLKDWERRTIELRASGYPYKDVVENLCKEFPDQKHSEQSLKDLFMHNGRLRRVLDTYIEIMNLESIAEASSAVKQAAASAALTQVALLQKDYPANVRLGASQAILDRTMGKATQKVEVEDGAEFREMEERLKDIFKPKESEL